MAKDIFRIWIDERGYLNAAYHVPKELEGGFADRAHMEKMFEALTYGQALTSEMIETIKGQIS